MTVLQIAALAAVALGGGAVVAAKDPLRQALVLSIYGLALTMLFFVFQAPDVALSEIVVSTVGLPVMLLLALRKIREHERARREEDAMSRTARLLLFGVGAAGLGAVLVIGLARHSRVRSLSGRVRPRDRRHRRRSTTRHRPRDRPQLRLPRRSTRSARNSSCSPRCSGSC